MHTGCAYVAIPELDVDRVCLNLNHRVLSDEQSFYVGNVDDVLDAQHLLRGSRVVVCERAACNAPSPDLLQRLYHSRSARAPCATCAAASWGSGFDAYPSGVDDHHSRTPVFAVPPTYCAQAVWAAHSPPTVCAAPVTHGTWSWAEMTA
jgi:hypothetical protein